MPASKKVSKKKSRASKRARKPTTASRTTKSLRNVRTDVRNVRSSTRKQVQRAQKGIKKSIDRTTKKLSTQNQRITEELEKLSSDMKALRTRNTPKREVSMYNLFMRKQIQQGKSFREAAKLWTRSRKAIENPESVGKRPSRAKRVTRSKRVSRRRSKPKPTPTILEPSATITPTPLPPRLRRRTSRRRSTPSRASQQALTQIMNDLSALKTETQSLQEVPLMPTNSKSHTLNTELSNEEVAVRLTHLYFEEIARLGFKRQLDFDSIINAYYYCLQRLQNKDKELEVMKKLVSREEAKMVGETKAQLFPQVSE